MDQFEYEILKVTQRKGFLISSTIKDQDLKIRLNEMGAQGWELVGPVSSHTNGFTSNIFLLFKRKLKE